MLIGKPPDIPSSEITTRAEYDRYMNRRRFLRSTAPAAVAALGVERLSEVISPRIAAEAGTCKSADRENWKRALAVRVRPELLPSDYVALKSRGRTIWRSYFSFGGAWPEGSAVPLPSTKDTN